MRWVCEHIWGLCQGGVRGGMSQQMHECESLSVCHVRASEHAAPECGSPPSHTPKSHFPQGGGGAELLAKGGLNDTDWQRGGSGLAKGGELDDTLVLEEFGFVDILQRLTRPGVVCGGKGKEGERDWKKTTHCGLGVFFRTGARNKDRERGDRHMT